MKKKQPRAKSTAYTQLRDPDSGVLIPLYTHGGQYQATPATMPSEAKIFGQRYKIYYHTRIYSEKKKAQRLLGVIMYPYRVIFLEPGQPIHMMREALYHEIAHAYVQVWRNKSEALSKLTYQQVEDICDMFGEAVPDLAGNNTIST